MQFIHALSLAPDVNDWLANSHHPRILHIFDHVCNLINERGEVLSIVTPEIGNGPFNLVVEDNIYFPEYLWHESPVSIVATQLQLSDLTIHTANTALWNPRPDWEKIHARRGDIGNELSQLLITNYPMDGRFTGFTVAQPPSTSSQSPISTLSSSLATADLPSSLIAAQKLAGLGSGLTPAGDDYIMGAIYAVWIIHPPAIASTFAKRIANTAAPLTTSLSAAWLRSAGRGETGVLWHQFFNALVSNDQAQIEGSMKSILSVGETSGADAFAGFMGVFMSWMEKMGSSHG